MIIFLTDTISRLVTSEDGVYIKKAKNVTIAKRHITINVDLNNSVKISIATDPEEIECGEYIMLTKNILSVEHVQE